jgi:hypothetical protein
MGKPWPLPVKFAASGWSAGRVTRVLRRPRPVGVTAPAGAGDARGRDRPTARRGRSRPKAERADRQQRESPGGRVAPARQFGPLRSHPNADAQRRVRAYPRRQAHGALRAP